MLLHVSGLRSLSGAVVLERDKHRERDSQTKEREREKKEKEKPGLPQDLSHDVWWQFVIDKEERERANLKGKLV